MEFEVNFGCWGNVFAVPSAVVDRYMHLASAAQLKVLLYLLRHNGTTLSSAEIAAVMQLSEETAEEAVEFWEQAGVLCKPGKPAEQFSFMQTTPLPAEKPESLAENPPTKKTDAKVQRSSKEIKLDPSEIAHSLESSQPLKDLFVCAESLFGRMLNHMEQRSLIWLHQYLGIRSEVILTLLGYCVSMDKVSMSYAESIAISWVENDILSLEAAEAEIRRLTEARTFTAGIQKTFGMNRKPTTQQQTYIDNWKLSGYSMELITYAYELTIESIDKLNFKYINTILEKWNEAGITTVAQAKEGRQNYSKKKQTDSNGMTEQEVAEMNDYLSLVNRFGKE